MKSWRNYSPFPLESYLMGLIPAYIGYFWFKSLALALMMPIFFFVLIATAILLDFIGRDKNLKNAIARFIFLLVVLSPIMILTGLHSRH